jgi:hypothetical protein
MSYIKVGEEVSNMNYTEFLMAYLAQIKASCEAETQAKLAKVRAELQALSHK